MKSVSKAELLKLIDEHLPDDAKIALFSTVTYEPHQMNMDDVFARVDEAFDNDQDIIAQLDNATHIIGLS